MVTLILYDFLLIWTKNLGQTAQNIGGAESAPPRTIRRPKSPDFLGLKDSDTVQFWCSFAILSSQASMGRHMLLSHWPSLFFPLRQHQPVEDG